MQFFQIEEEKQYSYKCLNVNQFNSKLQRVFVKPGKKLYGKYRDMKLAIQLIEKGQQKKFENQHFLKEKEDTQTLIRAQTTCIFRPIGSHLTVSLQNSRISSFNKKKLGVTFLKNRQAKFKNYLLRSKTIEYLGRTR